MSFCVYILYSVSKDKYYIGHTENLDRRLEEHCSRKNLGSTDWQVQYKENYDTRAKAMKREREIKRKKSRSYIKWLLERPAV